MTQRIASNKTDNMEAFNPNVKFRMSRSDDKGFSSFDAGYELLHQQPDMIHLLDVTDDSHPLFVWKGTDELHNRIDHLLNMQYKKNRKLHQKSMTIIGTKIAAIIMKSAINLARGSIR